MSEMKFEEALKKLEKIVAELERGDLPLEESLNKYEEGIRLSRLCSKKLESAKKKVEILLKAEDGSVELKPFDEKTAEEEKPAQEAAKKKKVKQEGSLF
jgi:exodeoxyribonuclease VII small subunit